MSLSDEYKNLIIKQYWDKPNAVAEILLKAGIYERIFNLANSFKDEFDLDIATGDRLDKIGKILGLNRSNIISTELEGFGFDDNPRALTFGSVFTSSPGSFYSILSPLTPITFSDDDYRFYLKAKAAVNSATAYISSDDKISIQDVIQLLFNGLAFVSDNKTMSITLNVDPSLDTNKVLIARDLGLLTRPQGVEYNIIVQGDEDSFAFDDDLTGDGIGDLFLPTIGGEFADLI